MTEDFQTFSEDFIQIFKFTRSTDEAIEEWAQALEDHLAQHPKDEPFYVLLDVSGESVEFTPAARQHSKRIFDSYRKRRGYIAMLFEWRTSPYFARLFFASLGKLSFKLNYFHNGDDARQWLRDMHDTA